MYDPDGRITVVLGLTAIALIVAGILATYAVVRSPAYQESMTQMLNVCGVRVKEACEELTKVVCNIYEKAKTRVKMNKYEKHHIVAQKAKLANKSRIILNKVKIGINSNLNLVPIKYNLHKVLHTALYYEAVNEVMKVANGKSITYTKTKLALNFIRATLLAVSSKTP